MGWKEVEEDADEAHESEVAVEIKRKDLGEITALSAYVWGKVKGPDDDELKIDTTRIFPDGTPTEEILKWAEEVIKIRKRGFLEHVRCFAYKGVENE